jgi:phospholipid/cholesterol/gamma-HCH transport system substrate-binding protein
MRRLAIALVAGLLVVVVLGVGYALSPPSGYRVSATIPNAIGLEIGSSVRMRGQDIGKVTKLEARDDQAYLEMALDQLPDKQLHAGATVRVSWDSVLGAHHPELVDGPASNPVLPSGAILESASPQVDVQDLFNTLDPPTRAHLQGMLVGLDRTLQGSQPDVNRTLQTAGPTVQALGAVLDGIGSDGQSIRTLVTNLRKVTEVLDQRKPALSSTILDLNRMTSAAAVYQSQLSDGLKQLPSTLDAAQQTLDKVHPASEATVPLLDDLRPATHRLPRVADNLHHVLDDLRPGLHDLPSVLEGADHVLRVAPQFLDSANNTLPQLKTTFDKAGPAVGFLRPYTPEIMGFFCNWGNAEAGFDSQSHYVSALVIASEHSLHDQPDDVPPGYWPSHHPLPGENAGQPWTDAKGSSPR